MFRVTTDGEVSVALEAEVLAEPNGIFWDESGERFIIASLDAATVFIWRPGDAAPTLVASGDRARFDGVEQLGDGRFVISSLSDSTVYVLAGDDTLEPLITGIATPADIGVDHRRGRILIPTLGQHHIEIWELQ